MVTKMDVSSWKILVFVWFRQLWSAGRLYLPVWLFASVNSQRIDEAYANVTCDLFVGFCDRCMKVDLLTFHAHAHALFHCTLPFDGSFLILVLSPWTVELYPTDWLAAGLVDITVHDGCGYGAAPSHLPFLCDVLLVSNKGWNPRGNRYASAAQQLHSTTAPLQWIMNV